VLLPTCYSSDSPIFTSALVEEAPEHEQHVGRSFAETSHEVGKPSVTEG